MTLDPGKTLHVNQDWLAEQARFEARGYMYAVSQIFELEEVKCQWSNESDKTFVDALQNGEARLVLPQPTLATRVNPPVKHSWMRYFLAVVVQQKLPLARIRVTGHISSNIVVLTGQKVTQRSFKLNLESPIKVGEGTELLLSFFSKLNFSTIRDTGLLYCAKEKVYVLMHDEYLLMTGPDRAVAPLKTELAKSFVFSNETPSFTYYSMSVAVSSFKDGHSITIDCDEATEKSLGLLQYIVAYPLDMLEDYAVKRRDMDLALEIQEGKVSDAEGEPLEKELIPTYRRAVARLKSLGVIGRMDICAVTAYLDLYTHSPLEPLQIHMRILQQVCYYLTNGPPYRLKFEYKPRAVLNAATTTRWFPYPIGVYAWFLGDCPIAWRGLFEPLDNPFEAFGMAAPRAAMDNGYFLVDSVYHLGLRRPRPDNAEVATMLYEPLQSFHSSVAGLPFYQTRCRPAPMRREGEPFTFAEDSWIDVERTVKQNQNEGARRFDRALKLAQESEELREDAMLSGMGKYYI